MSRLLMVPAVVFQLSFAGALLVSAMSFAQSRSQAGSDAIAGQQLFERQWQWIEPAKRTSVEALQSSLSRAEQNRLLVDASFSREKNRE